MYKNIKNFSVALGLVLKSPTENSKASDIHEQEVLILNILKLIKKKTTTTTTEVSGHRIYVVQVFLLGRPFEWRSDEQKTCTCKTSPHGFPEIREIFASGIRNLGNFHWSNRKSWALISGVQTKEYEIQESGFQVLDSRIHSVEYRIRGCLGFPYLEHFFSGCPYSCPSPPFVFSLSPLPPLLP